MRTGDHCVVYDLNPDAVEALAVIQVGLIVFLLYSSLLVREFAGSGVGPMKGMAWAFGDVFTSANFEIAMAAALVGYIVLEFLRKRF